MAAAEIIVPDERLELIGGELVPMSPKGIGHEMLKTALAERWYRTPRDDCDLVVATTLRLSGDTYLEPDVMIFPRAAGIKGLSQSNALLVVEIADASLLFDMGRKAALYASFGVRELWVIDAVKLAARVFRAPSPSGYGETQDFGASDRLVPLFAPDAFALRLEELEIG